MGAGGGAVEPPPLGWPPAGKGAVVASAYAQPLRERARMRDQAMKVLLVAGDCLLIGLQPILVHMSKGPDGKFAYSPISVNFATEIAKCCFAVLLLLYQARRGTGSDRVVLSWHRLWRDARKNWLLAVPALFYAINNYLKFVMQLYFRPATVKMLSNLKVLTIALLLKVVMKRQFTVVQWEALVLLILGITVNQLSCTIGGASVSVGGGGGSDAPAHSSDSWIAWFYTLMSVTIPSTASVFNEFALKKNFDTSVHLQNFFMYFFGAVFNFLFLVVVFVSNGGGGVSLFRGHSTMTVLLVVNNAAQGILSSFFFKFADTILKKYSSTVATVFTGLMSAVLFGHSITVNFIIGVSIVFISMHQFFTAAPTKGGARNVPRELLHSPSMEHVALAGDKPGVDVECLATSALGDLRHVAEPKKFLLPR